MVNEAVHESDNTRGVGEYVVPLGEGFVGDDDGAVAVASVDDLEEQISVAVVVG